MLTVPGYSRTKTTPPLILAAAAILRAAAGLVVLGITPAGRPAAISRTTGRVVRR